jgi:septation ring formation regulator EzrA
VNVPTLEELKRDLQILEVETEYDRMGRIKLTGNGCTCIEEFQEQVLDYRNMVPHLTDKEVDEILVEAWGEFWSDYP